nr:hypothetical protein [Tanacetum cinerariifolium]
MSLPPPTSSSPFLRYPYHHHHPDHPHLVTTTPTHHTTNSTPPPLLYKTIKGAVRRQTTIVVAVGRRYSHHSHTLWCRAVMGQPLVKHRGGQPPKTTTVVAAEPTLNTTAAPYGVGLVVDFGFELTGFSDVDYAGCKDTFKSTSGGAQFLGEKLAEKGPNYTLMAFSSSSSDSKIVDNYKKGLGYENYNAVPPPYIGNFMPPTPDLSFTGLDEFANKPVVKNCKAKSSEEETKAVRKNDDALIIEELVPDNEKENVSQLKIEKKTVRPNIVKKEFVKSKQQKKTARKTIKQVEHHRQNTHSPRGNQKN